MPNIGPLELGLVLIVALIILGPKKLPDMGRSLGKGMREFKGAISGETHDDDRDDRDDEKPVTAKDGGATPALTAAPTDENVQGDKVERTTVAA